MSTIVSASGPITMSFASTRTLIFAALALFASTACDDEQPNPYPEPEGRLRATLTGAGGVQTLDMDAPPGRIYVSIDDWGDRCQFHVGVYSEDGDTKLFVRVEEEHIAQLLAGQSQDATGYSGFFFLNDSVVRMEVEHDEGDDDFWYSAGGRVHIDALPLPGETMRVTFHDIQMVGHSGVAEDGVLNGEITATYRGAELMKWASSWTGTRACPEVPSPAD